MIAGARIKELSLTQEIVSTASHFLNYLVYGDSFPVFSVEEFHHWALFSITSTPLDQTAPLLADYFGSKVKVLKYQYRLSSRLRFGSVPMKK